MQYPQLTRWVTAVMPAPQRSQLDLLTTFKFDWKLWQPRSSLRHLSRGRTRITFQSPGRNGRARL